MEQPTIVAYSAFTDAGRGGNPAGVVVDAGSLTDADMLRIAQRLGFSETAFLTVGADATVAVRYFSPGAEVPFCGHATVAAAAALADRLGHGAFVFKTPVGEISLLTSQDAAGVSVAFRSAEPRVRALAADVSSAVLAALGLGEADLDARFPPRESWAGNWHPILVIADVDRFDSFTFDPGRVRALMDAHGWTGTVTVLQHGSDGVWQARNLFPVGAITEDPATGSAAASTGAYLRSIGWLPLPFDLVIHQGRHVGRPSVLHVHVPTVGGITVRGVAAPLGEQR